MHKLNVLLRVAAVAAGIGMLGLAWTAVAAPHLQRGLAACTDAGFSTEQSFMTRGPVPPDGNPRISDGDLLSPSGAICARNRDLLAVFSPAGVPPLPDLGLDAADIVPGDPIRVAFSTELDDPLGRFRSGDLLTTGGAVVPNVALLAPFKVNHDLGLDSVQLIGGRNSDVIAFLDFLRQMSRDAWLEAPGRLQEELIRYRVDIWFSTEGTADRGDAGLLLDGDLLSAATGTVVLHQADLLAAPIPAGLPDRGVDFGLDAVVASCKGDTRTVRFSTEIGYKSEEQPALRFSAGDLLALGGAVVTTNNDLVKAFEPNARDLGLDAITYPSERTACGEQPPTFFDFLPIIRRLFGR